MRKENLRILKMIEDGKITAEKAKELIDAIESQEHRDLILSDNYKKKMLTILIEDEEGDRVSVNLPVNVVSLIIKATGSLPDIKGNFKNGELEKILPLVCSALENEINGEIVAIDSSNGDKIKIAVE